MANSTRASLLEAPVLWAGRICVFYALLKAGLAGSPKNPLIAGSDFVSFFAFGVFLIEARFYGFDCLL